MSKGSWGTSEELRCIACSRVAQKQDTAPGASYNTIDTHTADNAKTGAATARVRGSSYKYHQQMNLLALPMVHDASSSEISRPLKHYRRARSFSNSNCFHTASKWNTIQLNTTKWATTIAQNSALPALAMLLASDQRHWLT